MLGEQANIAFIYILKHLYHDFNYGETGERDAPPLRCSCVWHVILYFYFIFFYIFVDVLRFLYLLV